MFSELFTQSDGVCALTNLTALSISASENTINGDFPPNSNDTFFTLLPAALDKMGGATNSNNLKVTQATPLHDGLAHFS